MNTSSARIRVGWGSLYFTSITEHIYFFFNVLSKSFCFSMVKIFSKLFNLHLSRQRAGGKEVLVGDRDERGQRSLLVWKAQYTIHKIDYRSIRALFESYRSTRFRPIVIVKRLALAYRYWSKWVCSSFLEMAQIH